MRKSNGFVFMETIVVVSVLSVTLLSLYSSFSFLIKKSRERETYDTTAYIYKTYLVVKEMEKQADARDTKKEAIVKYISTQANSCTCYDVSTGAKNECRTITSSYNTIPVDRYDRYLVACDLTTRNEAANTNQLKLLAKVYDIDKIYVVAPSLLSGSSHKKNIFKDLDATSIDYLNSKHLIEQQMVIVKYKTDYKGLSNDQSKTYSAFFASTEVE